MREARVQPSSEGQATLSHLSGDVWARGAYEAARIGRGLLLLPLISRFFGAAAYGIWSQIGETIGLFVPILSLQLDTAIVRHITGLQSADEKAKAFFSSFAATLALGGGVLIAGIIARQTIAVAMFADAELSTYALLFLGLLFVRSLLSIAFAYYRAHAMLTLNTIAQGGLLGIEMLGLLVSSWAVRSGFQGAVATVAAIDTAALLALGVDILRRETRISFSWGLLRKLLRYSLPLVPAIALAWVVNASDRYVIVHHLGLDEAGTYSAAYRLAQSIRILVHPLQFVLFPTIAALWERGERDRIGRHLDEALRWYAVLAIPAAAGMMAVGAIALRIFSAGVFVTSDLLVALLAVGELLTGAGAIAILPLYLRERTWMIPVLFLVLGAINLGLNLWWVPWLGILGAAASTCLCAGLQIVAAFLLGRRIVRTAVSWRTTIKATVASVGVYGVAVLLPVQGAAGLVARVAAGAAVYGVIATAWGLVGRQDIDWVRRR